MVAPQHQLRGPDTGSDREVIEAAIGRLGAVIRELEYPKRHRARLPDTEHIHREHRLIPSLVTVEAWLIDVHHHHDVSGTCGWCAETGCWAHRMARVLLGEEPR